MGIREARRVRVRVERVSPLGVQCRSPRKRSSCESAWDHTRRALEPGLNSRASDVVGGRLSPFGLPAPRRDRRDDGLPAVLLRASCPRSPRRFPSSPCPRRYGGAPLQKSRESYLVGCRSIREPDGALRRDAAMGFSRSTPTREIVLERRLSPTAGSVGTPAERMDSRP